MVAGVGYWAWTATGEASRLQDQVTALQMERQELDGRLRSMLAVDQRASVQMQRRGAVVQLTGSRINWERLVRDTATVIPERVWLTGISGVSPVAQPGAAPAGQPVAVTAAPQGIHLEGFAYTQPDVAKLMSRLDAIPGLGEPRLASADRMRRGDRDVIQFVIDAPVDQRAQDRPTLSVSTSTAPGAAAATPGTAASGGFVP
jgi:Tfp pilus assembly protein PilN